MAGIWAVHISAGVLQWPWLLGGYAAAGLLIVSAAAVLKFRSRQIVSGRTAQNLEDEIPRMALLTAVFFVGSLIHIRIGPTSVHLLLTGLVGLTLGPWACLVVPVGLCLQAVLLGHGDLSTLGVNTCVLLAPALMARTIYRIGLHSPTLGLGEAAAAVSYMLFPWSALIVGPAVIGMKRWERRLHLTHEYRAGFLVGFATVLLSVLFNGLVLVNGGNQNWLAIVLVVGAAHVPVAFVEGIITGFTISFLIRVKPELLDGIAASDNLEDHAIGVSSSSGTSH
jgi:cobalt/nickel transport system permease protein